MFHSNSSCLPIIPLVLTAPDKIHFTSPFGDIDKGKVKDHFVELLRINPESLVVKNIFEDKEKPALNSGFLLFHNMSDYQRALDLFPQHVIENNVVFTEISRPVLDLKITDASQHISCEQASDILKRFVPLLQAFWVGIRWLSQLWVSPLIYF